MRSLLLGLCCAGALASGAAAAVNVNNDVAELGLGIRYLFDSDFFAADNPGVNYATDTFPLVGDQAMGFGVYAALGHRFDGRRGPYEVLLKYYYTMASEDEGAVSFVDNGQVQNQTIVGRLDQHDLILAFRLPGQLLPVPLLNSPSLRYDLGLGVTTLAYDMERSSTATGTVLESTVRTRSGLAFNAGVAWTHELRDDLRLDIRADFILGAIQDVENADGDLLHYSPSASNLKLTVGLSKSFRSLF